MEYTAIRENQRREGLRDDSEATPRPDGASIPKLITPNSCVTKSPAAPIIPANINHLNWSHLIIGRNFLTKINANIGTRVITHAGASRRWVADPLVATR